MTDNSSSKYRFNYAKTCISQSRMQFKLWPNGDNLITETTSKKQQINVAIREAGQGIPQQIQEKLVRPLITNKSKGQGFELAVAKRII